MSTIFVHIFFFFFVFWFLIIKFCLTLILYLLMFSFTHLIQFYKMLIHIVSIPGEGDGAGSEIGTLIFSSNIG